MPPTPPLPSRTRRFWILFALIACALTALLLANNAYLDTHLWRSARWLFGNQPQFNAAQYFTLHQSDPDPRPFYMIHPSPFQGRSLFQRTEVFWLVFKAFAENLTILCIAAAVVIYHRRGWPAGVLMLIANISANIVSSLLRVTAGRYRPVAPPTMDGDNRWGFLRVFSDGSNLSFPSGHATAAFATAAALIYLAPKEKRPFVAALFLFLASGTALSRVVMLAHFPADALAGAAIGFAISWAVMHALAKPFLNPRLPSVPPA